MIFIPKRKMLDINKKKLCNKKISFFVNIYINAIVITLPLIVNNGYYDITQTKANFFYALTITFFVIFGFVCLFDIKGKKSFKIKMNCLDVSMLLFVAATVVSAFLSVYKDDVWFGEKSRYQGAVTIILYVLVYFAVSRNYVPGQTFLLSILLAFSVVSLAGVLNCFDIDFFGFYKPIATEYKKYYISTIGNVNFYSSYISLIFPLIICGFCQAKKLLSKIIYAITLVIGSFAVMVTSSESFVVGFAVSMIIIPLFMFNDKGKIKKLLYFCFDNLYFNTILFVFV